MTRHFQREMLTAAGLSAALTALMVAIGAIGAGLLAFSGWHGFGGPRATPTLELRAPAAAQPARPAGAGPHRTTVAASAPRAAARPRAGAFVRAAAPSRRRAARVTSRKHVVRHARPKPAAQAPATAPAASTPRPVAAPTRGAPQVVQLVATQPRGRTTARSHTHAAGRSHGRRHAAGRNGRVHGRMHAAGRNGRAHGGAATRPRGHRHSAAPPHARAQAPAGPRVHPRGGAGRGAAPSRPSPGAARHLRGARGHGH